MRLNFSFFKKYLGQLGHLLGANNWLKKHLHKKIKEKHKPGESETSIVSREESYAQSAAAGKRLGASEREAETNLQLKLQREEEQRRHEEKRKQLSMLLHRITLSNSLLGFIVAIICLVLLKLTASFSIPVVVGLLIFAMLFPQVERLHEKWGLPYSLSCAIVIILFHVAAFLLLLLISMASFNSLLQALPEYQAKLQKLLSHILQATAGFGIDISQLAEDWEALLGQSLSSATSIIAALSNGISNLLSSSFIIFLVLLFMLLEGKSFFGTIERIFAPEKSDSILKIYQSCVEQISFYLLLKTLISLLTGLFVSIGLWLLGLDFPIVWGILAFVLNFIPSIGSILHTLSVGLFSLLQFSDSMYFSWIIIAFLLLVQFCIGNYLEPKIQGSQLRLSPVFILLFLYIWGYIWGIIGMLLSVPILSVIKIICQNVGRLHTLACFLENAGLQNMQEQSLQKIERKL